MTESLNYRQSPAQTILMKIVILTEYFTNIISLSSSLSSLFLYLFFLVNLFLSCPYLAIKLHYHPCAHFPYILFPSIFFSPYFTSLLIFSYISYSSTPIYPNKFHSHSSFTLIRCLQILFSSYHLSRSSFSSTKFQPPILFFPSISPFFHYILFPLPVKNQR